MQKEILQPVILGVFVLAILLLISPKAFSQHKPEVPAYFQDDGQAIRGYDPVAYFTEGKAVKGKAEFTYSWKGASWIFDKKENMDLFTKEPEKYAPQYNGWCAYGVSDNHKAPTDPNAWTIVGNKLYLNYSPKVKELWIKDTDGRIRMADENWKTLFNKPQ